VSDKSYLDIVAGYEAYLERYGDNYLGVGWTKGPEYADVRYKVMLEAVKQGPPMKTTLLDFGCGASHLYEYILRHHIDNIEYTGLDLSERFISLSRKKFPHLTYYRTDILTDDADLPTFDYVLMNGVFTMRMSLTHEEMFEYLKAVVAKAFQKARVGIAFNVMSKYVDWERDDLFHLPFDTLASFLTKEVSRNIVVRHDYGLYEYTVYVYRHPSDPVGRSHEPEQSL